MVQAYILIQTEVGRAAAVASEVAGIEGVTRAEDVTGPYDVVVHVEAPDEDPREGAVELGSAWGRHRGRGIRPWRTEPSPRPPGRSGCA